MLNQCSSLYRPNFLKQVGDPYLPRTRGIPQQPGPTHLCRPWGRPTRVSCHRLWSRNENVPSLCEGQKESWGQSADRCAPVSTLRQRADDDQKPFLPLVILTDFSASRGDEELIFFFNVMVPHSKNKTRKTISSLL